MRHKSLIATAMCCLLAWAWASTARAQEPEATLPPELAHEPELALFGGDDGYAVLRPLVTDVSRVLEPGGAFAVELAPQQAEVVAALDAGDAGGKVLPGRHAALRARAVPRQAAEVVAAPGAPGPGGKCPRVRIGQRLTQQ